MELIVSRPSAAELLIAKYGDEWEIWCAIGESGKHGPRKARKWDNPTVEVTADTIQALADALQTQQPG